MILDRLNLSGRYEALHPLFGRAFAFLRDAGLPALAPGRYELDGARLFVSVEEVEGRGPDGARLEAHRRYIDIQIVLAGSDLFGWRPLSDCQAPAPFDEGRDIGFFDDRPDSWFRLASGSVAVLFPDDAHAPLAGRGAVKKAIAKVLVTP